MTHQITKVISAMSSMHRVKVLCRDYFYNPQNIQKILGSEVNRVYYKPNIFDKTLPTRIGLVLSKSFQA